MDKTVLIFGAGCAGLSAAHYLNERGFKVTVVETLDAPGGMARSIRYKDGMPSEYSWRGFGSNFYHNTFEVMKQIPIKTKNGISNVYDSQLSKPLKFYLLDDKGSKFAREQKADEHYQLIDSWRLTPQDKIKIAWIFAQGWTASNKRSEEEYDGINMSEHISKYLSETGARTFSYIFGPFVGSGLDRVSYHCVSGFFKRNTFTSNPAPYWHYDKEKDEYWQAKGRTGWYIMTNNTSDAWFDPWKEYLMNKGVEFRFNQSLYKLNYDNKKILSAEISPKNGDNYTMLADYYILATNPFPTQEVLLRTPDLLEDKELAKFKHLTSIDEHRQISFRLAFSEKINLPHRWMGFILTDSEFNLCFFAMDQVWNEDSPLGDGVKSIWSFTACVETIPGSLYDKVMKYLSREEFTNEVLHQIYKCKTLDDMVICSNDGKCLKDFELFKFEIWPTWIFPSPENGLTEIKGEQPKWVNQTGFDKHRPNIQTSIDNLYLSGAHCYLSEGINLWSMEGAVQNSRYCADLITKQDTVLFQKEPICLRPFQKLDKYLYKAGLPNIFNVLWLLIIAILIICYVVYDRVRWILFLILIMIGLTVIVLT